MKFLFCLTFVLSFQLLANEPALIKGSHEYYSTSEDVEMNRTSLSFRNNRRDLFWQYQNSKQKASDLGVNGFIYNGKSPGETLKAYELELLGAKKFNKKLVVEARLGGQNVEISNPAEESHSFATWGLSAFYLLKHNLNLELTVGKKGFFISAPYRSGSSNFYRSFATKLNATWRAGKQFMVRFRNTQQNISDGNDKFNTAGEFLYGISPGWPWIWAGPFIDYTTYSKRSLSYWSPSKFLGYGLSAESSFEIYKKLVGIVAANYSRLKENNLKAGNGYYGKLGLQYGDRNSSLFKGSWDYRKSRQVASKWSSQTYTLSYIQSF